MTGPEHYREAERRLRMAWEPGREPESMAHLVAEAQVHATLSLAAATALVDETPRSDSFDTYRAWQDVAGSAQDGDAR
ncbi:hypothetical protein ACIPXV_03055 [Streptomyces libani]|uniref:hypothetical protein n=1 Tax=Streptomyces nigrescens TaxID=1920 RepID=UPI003809EF86